MFSWSFLKLIGCLCVGIISAQDNVPELADIEPIQDPPVEVDLSVNDGVVTTMISTTPQTPGLFSCHECAVCKSESDYVSQACDPGINMCYKMETRIGNNSRIIRRGCSVAKSQCVVPHDDRSSSVESITCCTSHKCNQATPFQPLFFLSTLSLLTSLIHL